MTQSGVSAFIRLARSIVGSAVLLLGSAGALAAQTGKLQGYVRDQAGAPIQNAQVIVVGTAFSALTNPQGYYFINNIPAGTVSLRASFIGYSRTEVAGVRILQGQTISQDIQLEKTAVQIEEITVVPADNPLVPRDEVTTKQRIDGDFTEALPADRVSEVLALQPGVVASAGTGNFSIRGGRTDEAMFIVDGVPVQAGNRGTASYAPGTSSAAGSSSDGIQIATNNFEQVAVTTGAPGAEYGNAQSGVINLVNRTGGSKFAGRLAAESDEMFGKTTGMGFNRVEGNLSGPLGANGLSFALGGALEGNRSVRSGKGREDFPVFVQNGIDTAGTRVAGEDVYNYAIYTGDCDEFANIANVNGDAEAEDIRNNYGQSCNGARLPFSSFSAYQMSGNINYSYGTGSRLRLSANLSQNQGRNLPWGNVVNIPGGANTGNYLNRAADLTTGFRARNQVYTLNWTQNLTKSTERALALDVNLSYQRDRFVQAPFADGGPGEGTLGMYVKPIPLRWGFEFLDSTFTQPDGREFSRLDCFVYNVGECVSPLPRDQYQATQATFTNRTNPYGLIQSGAGTFADGGVTPNFRLLLYREDRYVGRAALDWQFDRYNRVKIGGEYTEFRMENYSVVSSSLFFSDAWKEKPVRWAAFIEDRLDIGDVVVQLGLRYDRFDTRASRWNGFPLVSTSDSLAQLPAGTDPRSLFVRDQAHDYLSPRLQVAFPVTERTNFRLSYAHQVQTPDFAISLQGINTDWNVTNSNQRYGTDLDFGKTIAFEFGIRHAFNDDMVLDIAAYNKDNLANAAGRLRSLVNPNTGNPTDVRVVLNEDFGNTRGIDLRLDRRFGQLFNGTLAYSFQQAQSTGSDPFAFLNFGATLTASVTGQRVNPPQAIVPNALSRPHSLTGALQLAFPNGWQSGTTVGSIFQNFSAFALFRFQSGTAFTGCTPIAGNQSTLSGQACDNRTRPDGSINSRRLPMFKELDMRFVKGFNLGTNQFAVYLDARNILNFTNTLTQFVTTSDIVSPTERDQVLTSDVAFLAAEADANGALQGDGTVDLTFGGAGIDGCGTWELANGDAAAPSCVYLLRAEQRFGNGDGLYTVEEQEAAILAAYNSNGRGPFAFYGAGRQLRLGVEFNF